MKSDKKLHVLLEMRPALDGYAGIPQETRLLFRGLCMVDSVEVEGLLQTSLRFLTSGMKEKRDVNAATPENIRLHRYSRLIVSLDNKPSGKLHDAVMLFLKRRRAAYALTLSTLFSLGLKKVGTSFFESRHFEDYIWQALFAKTLQAGDFSLVTAKNYRVCTVPWNIFQSSGLHTAKYFSRPAYPKLDVQGVDIFIAQTPYPARINKSTALVVRYHDALPVFMPHAFANKSRHQATHFHALESNVKSGAYFACVSEATRQDLIRLYPEVRERSVAIHNMVSHHYFEEESPADSVPQIVRSRLNVTTSETHPQFRGLEEKKAFYHLHLNQLPFKYLLMVSTIEPRKNHSRLIAAWEIIRAKTDSALKLVIVGNLGWDVGPIMKEMRTWIDQGELFVLNGVPASDLRVLYKHAMATVCPSVAEGFDFSGAESMRSGGITIASDIPVHREVYMDAAEYFEPYSTPGLVSALEKVLYAPNAHEVQARLRLRGKAVSMRYLPEAILPQWDRFLKQVAGRQMIAEAQPGPNVLLDSGVI